jgi:hypothetical protein
MYAVSVMLKNSSAFQPLYFKHFKNADEAYKKIKNIIALSEVEAVSVVIEDDFESFASIVINNIAAVSFTDVEREFEKQAELEILRTKAMLRGQAIAKNDPALSMLNQQAQPSILKAN